MGQAGHCVRTRLPGKGPPNHQVPGRAGAVRIRVLLQSRVSKLLGGLLLESMAAGHLLTAHMCRQQLGERAGGVGLQVCSSCVCAFPRAVPCTAHSQCADASLLSGMLPLPARVYGSGMCVCAAMMRLLPSSPSCAPRLSRPTHQRSEFGSRGWQQGAAVLESSCHTGSFFLLCAVPVPANATASSAVVQENSLMSHTKRRDLCLPMRVCAVIHCCCCTGIPL